MSFCGGCGTQTIVGDAYCIDCGHKLRREDVPLVEAARETPLQSKEVIKSPATSQPRKSSISDTDTTASEVLTRIRKYLGFHMSFLTDEAKVNMVFPGTPAFGAGLIEGDVIVEVGQVTVGDFDEFIAAVRDIDLQQRFTFTVVRLGSNRVIEVDPSYRPPQMTPPPRQYTNITVPASRNTVAGTVGKLPAGGTLILGLILIVAGIYFGNYAGRSFACNAASAFGVKQPISCVWYQFTYEVRDWFIGFGIFFALGGVAGLFLS